MEQSENIVDLVSTMLDMGKYKEALNVPNEEKYIQSFKDNCWDLLSVVIGKINDDTIVIKPSLHGTCEQLLDTIIQKSAPEESLLEFIEQIELSKNDAQFSIILTPLQQLLKKLSAKRGRSLEWCLNSISTYIETIPTPEYQLEGKERLLMDCDANVRRITKVYSVLPPFYAPIIEELSKADSSVTTKQITVAFLISLLGKPVIYIDMDPECHADSEVRACCTTIIQDICTLEKNVLKFIEYVEVCYTEAKILREKTDNGEKSPYEHREKINLTTLSGLFYVWFSDHFVIPDTMIAHVYSTEYIVRTLMLCVIHLMTFPEYGPLSKAMALCKSLLKRVSPNVSHTVLVSAVPYNLCKSLVDNAIYCSYDSIRKDCVKLISCYVNKFDYKGRCMLIKFILDTCYHSGMIGYAITLYKNSLDEAFKCSEMPQCFVGAQLMNMVKKICFLPHGAESDLVELAEQIITALNFLRYLVIRDTENLTGIRDCFTFLESDYLDALRTGLNMSKAHYEVKLKDLEDGKGDLNKVEVSINVGGNMLDNIPLENKTEIIHSALNAFHLIEGLVARLSECININKMQELSMES